MARVEDPPVHCTNCFQSLDDCHCTDRSGVISSRENKDIIPSKIESFAVITARVVCPCCSKAIWIKVEQTTSNQEIE